MDAATIVIGATGILRPAAVWLAAEGQAVIAVARDRRRLTELAEDCAELPGLLVGLAADATSPGFVQRAHDSADNAGVEIARVAAYAPATNEAVLAAMSGQGRVPVLQVLTSSAAAPAADALPTSAVRWDISDLPPAREGWRRLVLGWQQTGSGPMWHTPEDLSRAVVSMLSSPESGDRLLGAVRPWAERP
jgi:hypothetical protein